MTICSIVCLLLLSLSATISSAQTGSLKNRGSMRDGVTRRMAVNAEADAAAKEADEGRKAKAAAIADQYPNDCNVSEASTGRAVNFFPPFTPSDSYLDVWCKVQSFKSTEPIQVSLLSKEDVTIPLFSIRPEKQASKNEFIYNLVLGILRNSGANFYRSTRRLADLQIPDRVSESSYRWYDGNLQISLSGIEIQGLTFTFSAMFSPNAGLLAQRLNKKADYLHVPHSRYDPQTRQGVPEEIGFPLTVNVVGLLTDDKRIDTAGPEFKRQIFQKYPKFIKQREVADPDEADPTHRVTKIEDAGIRIIVHEGRKGNPRLQVQTKPYLQVNYVAVAPLDQFAPGREALKAVLAKLVEGDKEETLKKMGKSPF